MELSDKASTPKALIMIAEHATNTRVIKLSHRNAEVQYTIGFIPKDLWTCFSSVVLSTIRYMIFLEGKKETTATRSSASM